MQPLPTFICQMYLRFSTSSLDVILIAYFLPQYLPKSVQQSWVNLLLHFTTIILPRKNKMFTISWMTLSNILFILPFPAAFFFIFMITVTGDKFTKTWNQTADHCDQQRPLYQLSNNLFPPLLFLPV